MTFDDQRYLRKESRYDSNLRWNGELIPVTVVEAKGNVVLQKKTEEVEGYNAIQLGFDDKRPYDKERKDRLVKVANKPEQGHADKANTAPKRFVREIRDAEVAIMK